MHPDYSNDYEDHLSISIRHDSEKWKKEWPHHCHTCKGWGITGSTYEYGNHVVDICEAVPYTQCHRCGKHGLDVDNEEYVCKYCSHDHEDPQDGDPIVYLPHYQE